MRLGFIFSLFMAFFFSNGINAHTLGEPPYEPILEGEIEDANFRSVSEIPIRVLIYDDYASVAFSKPVGDVKISIKCSNKEVYSSTMNVEVSGETCSISLAGYASGTYLIEFTTPEGGYVYGWFMVE